ncbi:TonB-dependent receptor [Pseudomonas stutzeri]|nr:TonB-dependent receptor [Stutzerimonas stutzeri]
MKPLRHPLALAIGLALPSTAVLAAEPPLQLEATEVSASALASSVQEMTTPAEVLEGDELVQRRAATLGETLDGLPGVQAAGFGAGASRPVIRGLDGGRVKVLSDGVDVLDTSTLSQDHAVTVEPLLAERIEVLKGPATLLYGGGAIGGVVNVIDKRVPTYVPEKGYEGELELRANSVANEGAGLLGITAGSGNLAVRVEGVKRQADDYEIPGAAGEPRASKQLGAYNDTESYSLGGSFIGERGYLGLAYARQENRYGLLAHEHVDCHQDDALWHCGEHDEDEDEHHDEHGGAVPYIRMQQDRWDLRGELGDPLPGFELARLRIGYSDYRHAEIEGGEKMAVFDSQAHDARLELTHQPLLGWRGVVGVQTTRRDLERRNGALDLHHEDEDDDDHAHGDELLRMAQTLTRNHALFLLEEYRAGDWRYELGARHEWQSIDAESGFKDSRHRGTSLSAGAVWSFAPEYSLGLSLSRSQRLPSAEELYAWGPHAASRTIEHGNLQLDEETSHNAELTLRKLAGPTTFTFSLFRNQVDDFIYAADLGRTPGGGYREVEYRQADAVLTGGEFEVRQQFTGSFAATLFGDHVRGRLKEGGALPRIPADRLGVRLEQRFSSALDGQLEFYRVNRQTDSAAFETDTAGYNMLGAGLSYRGSLSQADYLLYLKADNLLDAEARQHSSLIKDEVLLPGRNFTLGMRVSF